MQDLDPVPLFEGTQHGGRAGSASDDQTPQFGEPLSRVLVEVVEDREPDRGHASGECDLREGEEGTEETAGMGERRAFGSLSEAIVRWPTMYQTSTECY